MCCVCRVKLLVREGLHCLAIDRCAPADQGVYTAKTNKEESSCDVQITGNFVVKLIFLTNNIFRIST